MAIAGEKAFKPHHVAILRISDDRRATRAQFDHGGATHHQGIQDSIAEFRLGYEQRPDLIRWNQQDCHRSQRAPIHERCLARELSHLSQHLSWTLDGECFARARFEVSDEFDVAGEDHGKTVSDIADIEQGFPRLKRANLAKTTDPFDLLRRQENGYS